MAKENIKKTEGRLPPQNIEAEQSVLGSLMLDKEAIIKIVDFLKPDDFYRGVHADIYQAMLELYEKSEPIDLLSLTNRLQEKKKLKDIGGAGYLTELVNSVPTAGHIAHYAKIVKNKKSLRDLIAISEEINQLSFQEPDNVEDLVDTAEQRIFSVSQKTLGQKFIQVKDTLAEAFDRIDKLHRGEASTRGVPTGFIDLDNILSGFQKSDLILLGARPSLGKTSLALDIARHVSAKEKLPVAIFSIEMSKEQLVDRLICSQAGIDFWKMRTGRLSGEGPNNDFEKIQRALDELSSATIFIDDTPSPTVLQMRTMARRLRSDRDLSLIIIDYLQLIQSNNHYSSPVQQMSEISRSLKGLAREINVPVLAISQLSRSVESRSPAIPKLSDLRESGCLTGDTLIISAKTGKRIPIEKLAQRKTQKPIKIFAVDDNYKITPRLMTKAFYSGKKTIYELKTKSGRTIKASSNHPFLKLEGWTRLSQLRKNDSIATVTNLANPNIYWDKIVSIKKIGIEKVYDATVKGTHNFVANDVVVHNSLEQDADVVLFIYREDKERPNTDRKNIADIYIAKHRNGPTGKVELYFNESQVSFRNLERHFEE